MAHYRYSDYENGRRLTMHGTIESRAETKAGFLRLFYSVNPRAPRNYFAARLHDDGADILNPDGETIASFIRESE